METRATCLNCLDGRVQLPALDWIKANYPVEFVDVITEAGMDGILARPGDITDILRRIRISVDINKSSFLFVIGHFDCRGNPVDEKCHRKNIIDAVHRLKPLWPALDVTGLWINQQWQAERVS